MANNIKEILDILNMTQNELAKRLEIDRQSLYQTISSVNPRKFNKRIAEILNINEDFITKQDLTTVDKLLIKKQHLMAEVSELPADEVMAYSGEAELLDRDIKLEGLFEKIRSQINIEDGDDTIFNVYHTIAMYIEKINSVESKIIKLLTNAMKHENYEGYIRGEIPPSQRQFLLTTIAKVIADIDNENRKSI